MNELITKSAYDVVQLLREREISPVDVVTASTERISEIEGSINAMPTLCLEQALDKAQALERQKPFGQADSRGWLAGLPISVKDLTETAGVKTTFGSPIYRDYIPSKSDILVRKLEFRGAIMMGKSNTPEFGAGASTFNEVFGVTRNPWDTTKSVAGSSGGACASVATGEVWLATGSDLGGSLRTPASFNSVVGLRPSPGRIPRSRNIEPFSCMHVQGPIARNCRDTALFLDVMAGFHSSDPLSYPAPQKAYMNFIDQPIKPRRIGYSPDLGITVIDPEVEQICRKAVQQFESIGTQVEQAGPNFNGSVESFGVLRAASFVTNLIGEYEKHEHLLKPEIVWNIERGMQLSAQDIGRAQRTQAKILKSMIKFFDRFDLLVCPCAIVPPFDADMRFVESLGAHTFDTYYEWIAITFALTLTGCPVLAVPAGFTADGLPVGIQIVGPPRDEGLVLSAGHLLEQMTGIPDQLPIDPNVTHL